MNKLAKPAASIVRITFTVLCAVIGPGLAARADAQITPPTPVVDVTNPAFGAYQDEACAGQGKYVIVRVSSVWMALTVAGKTIQHGFTAAPGRVAMSQQVSLYQDAGTPIQAGAWYDGDRGPSITWAEFAQIPDGTRLVVEYVTAKVPNGQNICFTLSGHLVQIPKPVDVDPIDIAR